MTIADMAMASAAQSLLREAIGGWKPIDSAPKDRLIEVRGHTGPYGITSWTGVARWGCPANSHKDDSTWLTEEGAVLGLAGYIAREWR